MSCLLEDLSPSQEEALLRLRSLLTEQKLLRKKDDDYALLRFLRARSFDVSKAKAMYEAMIEWRQEIGADTIKEVGDHPFGVDVQAHPVAEQHLVASSIVMHLVSE